MEEKEEEYIKPEALNFGCGSEPIRPGSDEPGSWQCRGNSWVWVPEIGG